MRSAQRAAWTLRREHSCAAFGANSAPVASAPVAGLWAAGAGPGVEPVDTDGQYDYDRVKELSFTSRKDRSRIIYNGHITLAGIPKETFDYQVNGESAREWILGRYQVTTDKDSQITNDPNDHSREVGNPHYIIDLIKRIVTVSVEPNKIVAVRPARRSSNDRSAFSWRPSAGSSPISGTLNRPNPPRCIGMGPTPGARA